VDVGGVGFDDDRPDTLAEALAVLERGLTAHFERDWIQMEE
jgi:hypothetical protein